MNRFDDDDLEEIYKTRFNNKMPQHVSVAAHEIVHPLLAARDLNDVAVLGDILCWDNLPGRFGIQVDGKWHITFEWEEAEGAFRMRLERR